MPSMSLDMRTRFCAFCREPLWADAQEQGSRFFCNELCADASCAPQQPPSADVPYQAGL